MTDATDETCYEIVLRVPCQDEDAIVSLLHALGGNGAATEGDGPNSVRVLFYVDAGSMEDARGIAASLLDRFPEELQKSIDVAEPRALDETRWTENWRKHFKRLLISDRIEIIPPWCEPSSDRDDLISLTINPGMAFGTGHHETTELCVRYIVELLQPGGSFADIGCGSGILAMTAAKLGAREVVAIDNDPVAVDIARENTKRNSVQKQVDCFLGDSPSIAGSTRRYDFIAANILADTLIDMQGTLVDHLTVGGTLVLSGIEKSQEHKVSRAFDRKPLELSGVSRLGDWIALALTHTSTG